MATFDGENLIVTLDAGTPQQDVQTHLYEPWKNWLLSNPKNMGYPALFRTVGGDPLSSVINAGAYFFIQNQHGWRIKPPEENGDIFLTGNLAIEDTAQSVSTPTVGGFTAFILGLQPVTQGVTPAMGAQVKFSSYQGGIAIDPVNGTDAVGDDPQGNPYGSRQLPVKTMDNVLSISTTTGLRKVYVMDDLTVMSTDISAYNFTFVGDSPSIILTVDASANVTGSAMELLTVIGELDGLNVLRNCSIGNITNVSGFIENCAFFGSVSLNGDCSMFGCYDQAPGDAYPVIAPSIYNLTISGYHGDVGLSAMTGGVATIELYGGKIYADSLCTGGVLFERGEPFGPVVDNGATCTVIDQTAGLTATSVASIKDAVWQEPVTNLSIVGSIGELITTKLLTFKKFFGTKDL